MVVRIVIVRNEANHAHLDQTEEVFGTHKDNSLKVISDLDL